MDSSSTVNNNNYLQYIVNFRRVDKGYECNTTT